MAEAKLYRDKNLLVVFGVSLMAVLGVSSITPAFPRIVRELGISGGQVGLLITFFTLPGVMLAPLFGILADRFGRKEVLVPSLFIFGLAGTACAFFTDFDVLLFLRAVQGIGGAALGSLNVTIIGDLYSGRRCVEAMGLNASVLAIGVTSYPLIGGVLALLGWRYPFLLSITSIPIGILVLTILKSPKPKSPQPLKEYLADTLTYLKKIKVLGLFCAGVFTFILFYGTILTYLPLLLGERFNASPSIIGLILSIQSLITAASSSQMGRITRYISLGKIIAVAFCIYGIALFMIPFVPSLWLFFIPALLFGIAHGTNIPSIQTAVAEICPPQHRAILMTLNGTMFRLGQTIGPPLLGLPYVYFGLDPVFFTATSLALMIPLAASLIGLKVKG